MSEAAPHHNPTVREQMAFRDHLIELRRRMLYAALGVGVAFFAAWAFHLELYTFISSPVRGAMADNGLFAVRAMQITESISVYIKIALLGGFFLASPWVFYQVWAFIAPGLLNNERRFVGPVVTGSVMFFVAGAAFCYLIVLPFMTDFLIKMTVEGPDVSLVPTLQNVVSYSLWLLLAFGLVFQLPVFMYFLSAMQIVTARGLLAFYRYWVVISFIIGAILTPTPDPVNQALMSGPLVLLYGVGVGIAWVVERDREAGTRWSWRGATALALVLCTTVLLGGTQLVGMTDRRVVDDLPLTANQLVAVRAGSLPRLMQQAGNDGKKALGPLAVALDLGGRPLSKATLWLVRFKDGAAAAMPLKNSRAAVRKLSRKHMASEVDYAGGKSVLITLPDSDARWRVVAPDNKTLWVGHDAAVGKLAATRRGQLLGLGADAKLADVVDILRSQGPLFALSRTKDGIAGWLPAGALAGTVNVATAVVPPKGKGVSWQFECRGPEAASALRNRIDAWAADTRAGSAPEPKASDTNTKLREQIGKLAELLSKTTTAIIRTQATDDQTMSMLREAAAGAEEIRKAVTEPPEVAKAEFATALQRAISADAVVTAADDGPDLRWQLEVAAHHAIDVLFAPSSAGIRYKLPPAPARKKKAEAKSNGKSKAGARNP